MRSVVLCVVVALAACGPSAAEVRTAQTARYAGPADDLYAIARQTTLADYKIGDDDPSKHELATVPQWYSPEGNAVPADQLADRSMQLTLVVGLVKDDNENLQISVTPVVYQYLWGSKTPRKLTDSSLPTWISSRVEALELAIYKHAQKLLVQPAR
jgi:hypothetical protein